MILDFYRYAIKELKLKDFEAGVKGNNETSDLSKEVKIYKEVSFLVVYKIENE